MYRPSIRNQTADPWEPRVSTKEEADCPAVLQRPDNPYVSFCRKVLTEGAGLVQALGHCQELNLLLCGTTGCHFIPEDWGSRWDDPQP